MGTSILRDHLEESLSLQQHSPCHWNTRCASLDAGGQGDTAGQKSLRADYMGMLHACWCALHQGHNMAFNWGVNIAGVWEDAGQDDGRMHPAARHILSVLQRLTRRCAHDHHPACTLY
jgi:hypothetical protein